MGDFQQLPRWSHHADVSGAEKNPGAPTPQRFCPPVHNVNSLSSWLLEMGIRGTVWSSSKYSSWIHQWLLASKQGDHSQFGEAWKTSKLLISLIASDQKQKEAKEDFRKDIHSLSPEERNYMLKQIQQDLIGTASNRFSSILTCNPLKFWEEKKRNEVSLIE